MSARPEKSGHSRIRERLAKEAARLISTGEAGDYLQARRKAAQRLGIRDKAALPANDDIEEALRGYQRLFRPETGTLSRRYREATLEAMAFLEPFQPMLTGAVLDATADTHTVVTLHLHHDYPDAVGQHLDEHGIPADAGSVRLRLDPRRDGEFPVWRFIAGDTPFELVVLPSQLARQAPLAPGDGRPMRRATAAQLQRIMREESPHTGDPGA